MDKQQYQIIKSMDMHTGGEPLRIILDGYPAFEGLDILAIRTLMANKYDDLRKVVMWEPRGHADMYGLLRVAPQRPDSAFGVIFMHNEGYSTMCGHATIAIGRAAVDLGWVQARSPETSFCIDAPCGQVRIMVEWDEKQVRSVSFENVPSFFVGTYSISIEGYGDIEYDLAYGGAFYAYVPADSFGLRLTAAYYAEIIRIGRLLKKMIIAQNRFIVHPFLEDLSFLYGVIFTSPPENKMHTLRNACVFANGEVDRCATGSGVSGWAAIQHAKKRMLPGKSAIIESIIGSTLEVEVTKTVEYGEQESIIPKVSGMAYYTGQHEWWVDPEDPYAKGFILR